MLQSSADNIYSLAVLLGPMATNLLISTGDNCTTCDATEKGLTKEPLAGDKQPGSVARHALPA